ncbi:hypothetical protein [Streptomyces pseudovenezuelae]|uniref:hypothetical protein n=1 Tax=Streptomyces pseudovenezuelae TaxID=67350 RepID=UPI0036EC8CA9
MIDGDREGIAGSLPKGTDGVKFAWGKLWFWISSESPEPSSWTTAVGERHRIAAYQVMGKGGSPGIVLGAASIYPTDTAYVLNKMLKGAAGYRTQDVEATLDPKLIDEAITGARIASASYYGEGCSKILSFNAPVAPIDLSGDEEPSAVSLYLDGSDIGNASHHLVSMFKDGQFYVSDCLPDYIGWVAREISPLWRIGWVSNDAERYR